MAVRDVLHMATVNYMPLFTLSADVSPETAYPLTNLQNQHADEPTVIDMTGETEVTIQATSATAYTVNSFSLWNHNLPADATFQLLLYPDESYGGTPYDSTALSVAHTLPWGAFLAGEPFGGYYEDLSNMKTGLFHFFDEFTFKSFKTVIAGTTFTDGLISIDKAWLAPAYAFEHGHSYGSRFGISDTSEHQAKPGGGMETIEGVATRFMNLDIRGASDTELILVENMFDRAKLGGDILISADPNNTRGFRFKRSMIGRRLASTDFTTTYFNGNSTSISVGEN